MRRGSWRPFLVVFNSLPTLRHMKGLREKSLHFSYFYYIIFITMKPAQKSRWTAVDSSWRTKNFFFYYSDTTTVDRHSMLIKQIVTRLLLLSIFMYTYVICKLRTKIFINRPLTSSARRTKRGGVIKDWSFELILIDSKLAVGSVFTIRTSVTALAAATVCLVFSSLSDDEWANDFSFW